MRAALEGTNDEFKALLDIGARYDVEYPNYTMPVFTRRKSLASILMTSCHGKIFKKDRPDHLDTTPAGRGLQPGQGPFENPTLRPEAFLI